MEVEKTYEALLSETELSSEMKEELIERVEILLVKHRPAEKDSKEYKEMEDEFISNENLLFKNGILAGVDDLKKLLYDLVLEIAQSYELPLD